jgi:hypothetical protein
MDVGVEKKAGNLMVLLPQNFDRVDGAVGATDMQQDIHGRLTG